MCLHETKWVGEKEKESYRSRFKLWYTEKVRSRNVVCIIVDKEWMKDVMHVKMIGDQITTLKLIMEQHTFNVISAYAPQLGLEELLKERI